MRFLIIHDKKITKSGLDTLTKDFSNFVSAHTGIIPTYFYLEHDYTYVPTETDSDGDLKPTKEYTTALMSKVHSIYGQWGIDHVAMLIHSDNWVYTGIWGTNWSNVYYQYHVHLCRFDGKNAANSFGTLYHEWMHSLDALIKTHTGVDINKYFTSTKCFVDYDATCVHGNKFKGCAETPYKYIRWKENTDVLAMIAPDLKLAYAKRKEMYYKPYITAALQIVDILRGLLNKKNGVPRT